MNFNLLDIERDELGERRPGEEPEELDEPEPGALALACAEELEEPESGALDRRIAYVNCTVSIPSAILGANFMAGRNHSNSVRRR